MSLFYPTIVWSNAPQRLANNQLVVISALYAPHIIMLKYYKLSK